jgi:hypothetical protein
MKYAIALYPYEEGGCVAEVLMLKGCLAQGETLSIKTLTQAQMQPSQFDRHTELLTQNQEDELTPEECQELTHLRESADQLMLRKAYA